MPSSRRDSDAVGGDPAPDAQVSRPGQLASTRGQVDHDLLGAFLQRGCQVSMDLIDRLVRGTRWTRDLREVVRRTSVSVREHAQRKQPLVECESVLGEVDGAGKHRAKACRITQRGQRHDGALFVPAPPPQMLGDGTVGVTQ